MNQLTILFANNDEHSPKLKARWHHHKDLAVSQQLFVPYRYMNVSSLVLPLVVLGYRKEKVSRKCHVNKRK